MSIILAIINVILMVILFLLLAVLLLMLIVLFTPIRYNVQASYVDKKLSYDVKASWFFRLFSVRALHSEAGSESVFRVAWKRFSSSSTHENELSGQKDEAHERESPEGIKNKGFIKENLAESKPSEPEKSEMKSSTHEKRKEEKTSIIDKIKDVYDKFKAFRELEIDYGGIFKEILLMFKRIFKALKPKILLVDCELGLDSPDQTGMAIGAVAVFKSSVGLDHPGKHNIVIEGNFEEEMLNLTTRIKGRFALWFGLWPIIRFCFSKSMKPIRKLAISKIFGNRKNRRRNNKWTSSKAT